MNAKRQETKVTIVGAGPAGLGCAALLKQMGIKQADILVLEAKTVGNSFKNWPKEMRLITPSFPSNGYHQTDLNAITPDTSPAFSIGKEHLSGQEYADYLQMVVDHYEIEVSEQTSVNKVLPDGNDGFVLATSDGQEIQTEYLIWAGGEYSSPRLNGFEGTENCIHNSQIDSWDDCQQDHYAVIGCYESGVDAAYNLAIRGKKVTLIDNELGQDDIYDPSRVLSPYTGERLESMANSDLVELKANFDVDKVLKTESGYELISATGERLESLGTPINCTGFETNLGPVQKMFEFTEEGMPLVDRYDESTLHRNLFLSGPKLVHGSILLCFIYKFRGRFASPCTIIGTELDLNTSILDHYKQAGMLLDDLSCCEEQECFC
jgi:thioredoxin reductase